MTATTHRTYIDTTEPTGDRLAIPWCLCGERGEPMPRAKVVKWCTNHLQEVSSEIPITEEPR